MLSFHVLSCLPMIAHGLLTKVTIADSKDPWRAKVLALSDDAGVCPSKHLDPCMSSRETNCAEGSMEGGWGTQLWSRKNPQERIPQSDYQGKKEYCDI